MSKSHAQKSLLLLNAFFTRFAKVLLIHITNHWTFQWGA